MSMSAYNNIEDWMDASGKLYIVASPIGNLADISQRAIETLGRVDLIACEDTRHTKTLLIHYGIQTPLLSYQEHNESKRVDGLIERLKQGQSLALISDAGTPVISDPGYCLVRAAQEEHIQVIPIPGACAAIAALSASGLASDCFCFEGFLANKEEAKRKQLKQALTSKYTSLYYEAPHRIVATITLIAELFGEERRVCLAKEISKSFESIRTASAASHLAWLNVDPRHQKGEFVLIIEGEGKKDRTDIPEKAQQLMLALIKKMPVKEAAVLVSHAFDAKKNALYRFGLNHSLEK
jgi:16S rRNA (cytidine1402-2'-O)-methyltransferase